MARAASFQARHPLQSNLLQNLSHAVSHCRSRSQRKVDNSKGHSQTLGSFLGYQLSDSCDLKGCLLNGLAQYLEILPLTFSRAVFTTPGPLTPTLMIASASVTPWKLPP